MYFLHPFALDGLIPEMPSHLTSHPFSRTSP